MRWLKFLLYFLLALAVLITGALYYLSSQYGALVEDLVIKALNDNLKSEVKIASVETGSLQDLPYFSLVFNDVAIMEDPNYQEDTDTLIYVKRLALKFNLWDIYLEDYQLKKVQIEDGFGRFEVAKKGEKNYIFWRSDSTSSDTSGFSFNLNEVELKKIKYSYVDKGIQLGVRTLAENANMTGNFTSENLEIKTHGQFNSTLVKVAGVRVVNNRDLDIYTGLQIDPDDGNITFMPGEIRVDNAFTLKPSGYIKDDDYSFECKSQSVSLQQLNSLVPPSYADYQKKFDLSGEASFMGSIRGNMESSLPPLIEAELKVHKAKLTQLKSNLSIDDVSFVGTYTNGKKRNSSTSIFTFENLSANFPSGHLKGNLKLEDLHELRVESQVKGELELAELQEFLQVDSTASWSGKLDYEVRSKLILSRLTADKINLKGSNLKGLIQLDQVAYKGKDLPIHVIGESGTIELKNKNALVRNLKGKFQSSSFTFNGQTNNFLYWLFTQDQEKSEVLNIDADLVVDKVIMEEFMFASDESEGEERTRILPQQPSIQIRFSNRVGELSMGKFKATNLHSTAYLNSSSLILDPISLQAFDGTVEGKIWVQKQRSGPANVRLYGGLASIDIQKLFASFNNFGQQEITDQNLRGIADVDISISGTMDQNLKLDPKNIAALSSVEISNGALINYSTLQVVSDYFNKNLVLRKLFKAKELAKSLEDVRFDRLQNEIRIEDEQVILPKMYIGSSVMGINVEGVYRFSDSIDYRFDFNINELLLSGKSDARSDEYMVEEQGKGARIFLRMYGSITDPIIEIDKERRKEYNQGVRREEGKELKSALNKEFGWFNKDTALVKQKTKNYEYEIEWEEAQEQRTDSLPAKKDSLQKKRKLRDLLKAKPKEETDEEFDFGDDDF